MKNGKIKHYSPPEVCNHYREIISSGSQHLEHNDPVAKVPFKIGDMVFVCEETGEAIAASSISKVDSCPFCGGNILQQNQIVYPSIDTGYTIWETLGFSLLIGGVSGLIFSYLQIADQLIAFLVQILLVCGSILLAMTVTKQPSSAVFAVVIANLIPIFTSNINFSTSYIIYFVISIVIAWVVSVNIKSYFR